MPAEKPSSFWKRIAVPLKAITRLKRLSHTSKVTQDSPSQHLHPLRRLPFSPLPSDTQILPLHRSWAVDDQKLYHQTLYKLRDRRRWTLERVVVLRLFLAKLQPNNVLCDSVSEDGEDDQGEEEHVEKRIIRPLRKYQRALRPSYSRTKAVLTFKGSESLVSTTEEKMEDIEDSKEDEFKLTLPHIPSLSLMLVLSAEQLSKDCQPEFTVPLLPLQLDHTGDDDVPLAWVQTKLSMTNVT
ncbi:uncharacterized protein VTP21DRAFT_1538 [Calcarisporiella thermophila]|uniref:uncharacterized protein n=1 Tax=Calcarisporiella thermophila TaxID=911321 RepID=UPI00374455FB